MVERKQSPSPASPGYLPGAGEQLSCPLALAGAAGRAALVLLEATAVLV